MSGKEPQEKLSGFLDLLDEALDLATEEEAEEELAAEGSSVKEAHEHVVGVLEGAITRHRRGQLAAARAAYDSGVENYRARPSRLPRDSVSQLALFRRAVEQRPDLAMTVGFRDLTRVSAEDVRTALEKLEALGALDELVEDDDDA